MLTIYNLLRDDTLASHYSGCLNDFRDRLVKIQLHDNLSVQASKWIADKIIQGDFAPGSRIMEEKIAEELGISRGPVREALLILQKQRLITLLPRRGAIVKKITASEITELYDVISILYTLLGQEVAARWKDSALEPLKDILFSMKHNAEKGKHLLYFKETIEFIRASFSIAKNKLLEELIEDLIPSVYRIQYPSISERKTDLMKHWKNYEIIFKAIEKRNSEKIAEIIALHNQQEQKLALSCKALSTLS